MEREIETVTVSIVIPTRNMADYLGQAVDSVRGQTYTDWELYIVDDGSTDSTPEVAAEYEADKRIHYWRQTNQERAAARNRGILASSGEYVAFLDADDLWQDRKLEKQVAALEAHPDAALCYTRVRYAQPGGTLMADQRQWVAHSGRVLPHLARGNFIPVSSVMVRRSALDVVGNFDIDPRLTGAEDWDLWLRMASAYPVLAVPEELTLYRVHHTPRSHQLILRGALAVVEKQFTNREFQKQAGITKNKAEAYAYLCAAGFASPSIARLERLRLLLKGISISPLSLASAAGALAFARVVLPVSVISVLQKFLAAD